MAGVSAGGPCFRESWLRTQPPLWPMLFAHRCMPAPTPITFLPAYLIPPLPRWCPLWPLSAPSWQALLGSHRVAVSSHPGRTKHFQTHWMTQRLVLCDVPGLVFPRLDVSLPMQVVSGPSGWGGLAWGGLAGAAHKGFAQASVRCAYRVCSHRPLPGFLVAPG